MTRLLLAAALVFSSAVLAQDRPMFETTKVEGTDNVYIFRYGNRQSMFIVTPDGVIATDPVGYGRPQARADLRRRRSRRSPTSRSST